MSDSFKYFPLLTALAAGAAFPAVQAATQAEVDEARNECRQNKLMVQDKGSFARDADRRAWEAACGRATALMDEMTGTAPSAVAAAPPTEPAADQAAFEAPAQPATTSAYHHFSHENQKAQAGAGVSDASATPSTPAVQAAPTAPPEAMETAQAPAAQMPAEQGGSANPVPDEAVLAPSSPPTEAPQEDEAEGDYIPPGP